MGYVKLRQGSFAESRKFNANEKEQGLTPALLCKSKSKPEGSA
jgi:hypothetical protein